MSMITDMRPMKLQKNFLNRSSSGAKKDDWKDVKSIEVAIYKNSVLKVAQTAAYAECSHSGLTYSREVHDQDHRLVGIDGTLYEIIYCNKEKNPVSMQLKEIRYGG